MATAKAVIDAMTIEGSLDYSNAKLLTPTELEQSIKFKERGFKVMIAIRLDAGIEGDQERCYSDAIVGAIQITQADALDFARRALSDTLVAKGARFRCYVTTGKGYDRKTMTDFVRRTLWISQ